MLVFFNNCNITKFTNKITCSEGFDDIDKILLDDISSNISFLVHKFKYGAINTTDTRTMVSYVIKYVSDIP